MRTKQDYVLNQKMASLFQRKVDLKSVQRWIRLWVYFGIWCRYKAFCSIKRQNRLIYGVSQNLLFLKIQEKRFLEWCNSGAKSVEVPKVQDIQNEVKPSNPTSQMGLNGAKATQLPKVNPYDAFEVGK